jgi:hypothetical protein
LSAPLLKGCNLDNEIAWYCVTNRVITRGSTACTCTLTIFSSDDDDTIYPSLRRTPSSSRQPLLGNSLVRSNKVVCSRCKKPGHIYRTCRVRLPVATPTSPQLARRSFAVPRGSSCQSSLCRTQNTVIQNWVLAPWRPS